MTFEWDAQKAKSNLRKHGVKFAEAVTVFSDPLALVIADTVHEERTVLIGLSAQGRLLLTVYAEVSMDVVRIISARRVTSHERKRYEEGQA